MSQNRSGRAGMIPESACGDEGQIHISGETPASIGGKNAVGVLELNRRERTEGWQENSLRSARKSGSAARRY